MHRLRSERGALLPIVALMLTALVGMAAFTVDIGMQRVARRDMQAIADAVALDLARLLDGRTAGAIRAGDADHESLDLARQRSAARNGGSSLGDPATVAAVLVELDDVTAQPVYAGGVLKTVAAGDVPDAVMVTASTSVDFAFSGGEGGAWRTAIANSQSTACFRMGSWALAVDPGNAADTESARLNEMLNDSLGVTALSYHGLADSWVSLLGLAGELGVGSAEEFVAVENLRLRDLFSASAGALAAEGGDAADVALLTTLAASVRSELDATVDLADLITATSQGGAGLAGEINVLDVLASSVYATDGEHLLDIQNLWSVPKFSQGTQELELIERPRGACGAPGPETFAETAQLRFSANPQLNTSSLALANGEPQVILDVNLAGARATLSAVQCGDGTATSPEALSVAVTRELSTVDLNVEINLAGEMKLGDLGLLNLADLLAAFGVAVLPGVNAKATLNLTVDAGTSVATTNFGQSATYAVPPRNYSDAEVVGDGSAVLLPSVTIEATDVTGTITYNGRTLGIHSTEMASRIDLSSIIGELTSEVVAPAINDFVAKVNEELAPVAALLGLHVNGVDIFGLRRPRCDTPALRG